MEYSTKFISINEQIDEAVYSLYTYSTFIFVSAVFSDIPAVAGANSVSAII